MNGICKMKNMQKLQDRSVASAFSNVANLSIKHKTTNFESIGTCDTPQRQISSSYSRMILTK